MRSIYGERDYKLIIRKKILEKKRMNSAHNFKGLADRCQIQKTRLCRILNTQTADFDYDQLFVAFEYLGFDEKERKYIELLYQHSTSQLDARKSYLAKKIEEFLMDEKPGPVSDMHSSVSGSGGTREAPQMARASNW